MVRPVIKSDRTGENIDYFKAFINVYDSQAHVLRTGLTLEGDIEIGAVEIKDATSDIRQNVGLDSAKYAAYIQSESLAQDSTLQEIKANQTNKTQATKITDGTLDADLKLNTHTSNNEILVNLEGHICAENSTSENLDPAEVFTGDWQDTIDQGTVIIGINSDQDSATDGLQIQWSADGNTVHDSDVFSILANKGKVFTFGPARRYVRLVYTNGGDATTSFNLQTQLKRMFVKPSSHRIQDAIVAEDDATLQKSVLTGENPAGTFVNFGATTSGNFKMSLEEFENDVSVNSNTQLKTTTYHEDGTAGQLITGIKKEAGKDGIDSSTNTLQIIDYEHHEIHSGSHYNYCDYSANSLASGAIIEFLMTTPNTTEWTHLAFEVYSATGCTIELFEGASGIVGGTTITPRNNNRNSSNTSNVSLIRDPTSIASDGVRAAGFLAGAGRSSGFADRSKENILKQNTTYLVRITSTAAQNRISWCAEWYEHTDKN